jgi:hypothetical protein
MGLNGLPARLGRESVSCCSPRLIRLLLVIVPSAEHS